MVICGSEDAEPESTIKIAEYVVPQNIQVRLESMTLWTSSDGHFTLYQNGQGKNAVRLSAFNPTIQVFFGNAVSLRPFDVISIYGYHGQSTIQTLGCSLILEQL